MPDRLEELRGEINDINARIATLFARRLAVVEEVAEYKQAHGMEVYQPRREQQVLEQVGALFTDQLRPYGQMLFRTIMDLSKQCENDRMASAGFTAQLLERAQPPREHPRVCCFGAPGSYSSQAARALFPVEPAYRPTFAAVFEALEQGAADYGVVPIENSNAGSVHEVYDLLRGKEYAILHTVVCPIRHSLLVCPGTRLEEIRQVHSHPQALDQCAAYLKARGWEPVAAPSTSEAARQLHQHPQREAAAIGSAENAALYGLEVLEPELPTESPNMTRFICVGRALELRPGADRVSLCFSLDHTTGTLYRTLAAFALAGLNITKIESRPLRSGRFEYLFYVDFEGSLQDPATARVLDTLAATTHTFAFLGNYPLTQLA